jgi:hypothetical protein
MDANGSGHARQHVEASPRLGKGRIWGRSAEAPGVGTNDLSGGEAGSRERQDVRRGGRPRPVVWLPFLAAGSAAI